MTGHELAVGKRTLIQGLVSRADQPYLGGHHGPIKVPQEETDPRVEIPEEPNFYYPQEDSVWKYCAESNGQTSWDICMPGPIMGAVPDAAMNVAYPLAVYATVCKELGEPLRWPGDVKAWQMDCSMSSAMMNAYMEEWAVLSSNTANQKFNTCDNSMFAWEGFWPRLAGWYGIDWVGPQDDAHYVTRETPHNPRGYGGKGISARTFTMVEWAKQSKVQDAWKKVAKDNGLSVSELTDVDRVFGFLDGSLSRSAPLMFR